jgi:hypothetical protein
MKFLLFALLTAGVYLLLGVIGAAILKQTPYALNPLPVMIFGWPLYFRGVAALFVAGAAVAFIIFWWFS